MEPDDTGFHAYSTALKGLHTCGNIEEEALQNATNAAIAYLQFFIKNDDPFPADIIVSEHIKTISLYDARHIS